MGFLQLKWHTLPINIRQQGISLSGYVGHALPLSFSVSVIPICDNALSVTWMSQWFGLVQSVRIGSSDSVLKISGRQCRLAANHTVLDRMAVCQYTNVRRQAQWVPR